MFVVQFADYHNMGASRHVSRILTRTVPSPTAATLASSALTNRMQLSGSYDVSERSALHHTVYLAEGEDHATWELLT